MPHNEPIHCKRCGAKLGRVIRDGNLVTAVWDCEGCSAGEQTGHEGHHEDFQRLSDAERIKQLAEKSNRLRRIERKEKKV